VLVYDAARSSALALARMLKSGFPDMKAAIAADHAGFALKEKLWARLTAEGLEALDFGPAPDESRDYPGFAQPVRRQVPEERSDRGILITSTGIGMAAGGRHPRRLARIARVERDR